MSKLPPTSEQKMDFKEVIEMAILIKYDGVVGESKDERSAIDADKDAFIFSETDREADLYLKETYGALQVESSDDSERPGERQTFELMEFTITHTPGISTDFDLALG